MHKHVTCVTCDIWRMAIDHYSNWTRSLEHDQKLTFQISEMAFPLLLFLCITISCSSVPLVLKTIFGKLWLFRVKYLLLMLMTTWMILITMSINWQRTETRFCGDCSEITISSNGGALQHLPEKSVLGIISSQYLSSCVKPHHWFDKVHLVH